MNKVKQTHIGMKNHNIETYLEMSLEDYLSGKKTSNDEYEITNYIGTVSYTHLTLPTKA